MQASNIRVDGQRLWDSLMDMAQIGPGVAGGNNRQALTDEDAEGRHLFAQWCKAAGMSMAVDEMGNMFARREGTDPDLAPIYIGSHLDTQPTGGKYDGVLGVLAALEAIRTMNDLNIRTRRPIVVVNWTNEEGTRFQPALLSSGVFAGVYDQDWAHAIADSDGATFGAELARTGWRGEERTGAREIGALFELHIEQGPILEAEGLDIGVVTGGQGQRWIEVTLEGREAHTGSTPMDMRLDASLGMARCIEAVRSLTNEFGPDMVGAVGRADLTPNSPNVIAGRAVFCADFRSPDLQKLLDVDVAYRAAVQGIAADLGLGVSIEQIGGYDPIPFDPDCVAAVREAAHTLGHGHRDMVSGAGHDACMIARIAPVAMIFCPCVGGLSHNEAEEITPDWATAGAEVLMHAALRAAEIIGSDG